MTAVERRTAVGAMVALMVAWVALSTTSGAGVFLIGQYISGGAAAALGVATTIVGYLNHWWGFALALAAAAAIGLSWTVVIIKGVLQKAGFAFAVRYASFL
jgi:hypothetical protein